MPWHGEVGPCGLSKESMGGVGVKDPWINFHRLQTLDEQAPADRCKALKARMMNGAEIAGFHWAREKNVLALAQ